MYKGGNIFCDCETNYVKIYHQSSFSACETVLSKIKFEKEALRSGNIVRRYRTDNGIYTSKEFMKEIYKENQGISHSGVGWHHHNGVAENNIKIIIRNDRVMQIYASMRWTTCSDKSLWPMSVLHEVQLCNHIPRIGSNLSPL